MLDYARQLVSLGENRSLFPDHALNVGGIQLGLLSEGEGVRNTLFVQGCPQYCPGCRNVGLTEVRPRTLRSIEDVTEELYTRRTLYFRTTKYPADVAYTKSLWIATVRSLAWQAASNTLVGARVGAVETTDYARAANCLEQLAMPATLAVAASDAQPNWTPVAVHGLTLSGGEPLLQARELASLVRALRVRIPEWSIWMYAGVRFEDLLSQPVFRELASLVDVIKAGSFTWKKRDVTHPFFGSSDQVAIDAKASLASGEPVLYEYPPDLLDNLRARAEISGAGGIPRLRPDTVEKVREIAAHDGKLPTIEDFEDAFGPADREMLTRMFEPGPPPERARPYAFLKPRELNVYLTSAGPLEMTELPCVQVLLQGSAYPPPAGLPPFPTEIRPSLTGPRPAEALLSELLDKEPWVFGSDLPEDEASSAFVNLALQLELYFFVGKYFLESSPYSELSPTEYLRAISAYRGQLKMLFKRGGAGRAFPPRSIITRVGDPMLQADGVAALGDEAHKHGLELWVEAPQSYATLSDSVEGRRLLEACDFVITGQAHAGPPAFPHPFLWNGRQKVLIAKTGEPWHPRFSWSKQLDDYSAHFASVDHVRGMTLRRELALHFAQARPERMTLEALESQLGRVRIAWPDLG